MIFKDKTVKANNDIRLLRFNENKIRLYDGRSKSWLLNWSSRTPNGHSCDIKH